MEQRSTIIEMANWFISLMRSSQLQLEGIRSLDSLPHPQNSSVAIAIASLARLLLASRKTAIFGYVSAYLNSSYNAN